MAEQPDNTTHAMGKTMMVLAWVVGLGLLVMYFSGVEEKAYNPNTDPNSQQSNGQNTVVLKRNRQHHYITNGTINQKTAIFLLDTGATDVVIPEELAKRYGLSRGAKQFANTANGTIAVYQTTLNQLSIGSITLYNVNASINPSMRGKEILLGMSALKNIEFTQRGNQLTLTQYH